MWHPPSFRDCCSSRRPGARTPQHANLALTRGPARLEKQWVLGPGNTRSLASGLQRE